MLSICGHDGYKTNSGEGFPTKAIASNWCNVGTRSAAIRFALCVFKSRTRVFSFRSVLTGPFNVSNSLLHWTRIEEGVLKSGYSIFNPHS